MMHADATGPDEHHGEPRQSAAAGRLRAGAAARVRHRKLARSAQRNRLDQEASPFLQQYAGQAIHWHPWGEEAFARATREDKPILVSIGYLACYWCHVMAEESFSDPRVVAAINRDFVAVKVDREERPDVDRAVLDAMARLGARTGWPVTAFMTPYGEVYAGGSYYPPEPRHGLPGFLDVLATARACPREAGPQGVGAARPSVRSPPADAVADVVSYAGFLANRLFDALDRVYGGFGETAPRFPQVSAHQLLWHRYAAAGIDAVGDAVLESLQRICGSALHDCVGGGFHRYCVDEFWTVPHFEKMLYDNAQLVELLTWVWRGRRCEPIRACIVDTADWALRDLFIPGAGFAASLGAHTGEGVGEADQSGRFYRWDQDQIARVLGADAELLLQFYQLCASGEGPTCLLLRTDRAIDDSEDRDRVASCVRRLRTARGLRRRPERDQKVMADWNGLMLVALVEAGSALGRHDWLAAARQAFDALTHQLDKAEALHHCVTEGVLGPPGFLEDYASMSRAALRLYEAFGKPRYLAYAMRWVDHLDREFWDGEGGGYFMTSSRQWRPTPRLKTITETSLPSGNGLMIGVLARLHEHTGRGDYRERAEQLVAAMRGDIVRHGIAAATAINNVLTLDRCVRIEVSGRPDAAGTRDLLTAALECSLPDRIVLGPGSGAKAADQSAPKAQLCIGTACLLPVTSADALRRLTAPGGLAAVQSERLS